MNVYAEPLRAVFDCMIFLQAVANDESPAAELLRLVDADKITLFVSDQVLTKIEDVLARPKVREKPSRITDLSVQALLRRLNRKAVLIVNVPNEFRYARDPKDEKYINLALAARAAYLVSRDKDLLDLMNDQTETGKQFMLKFPSLKIVAPQILLTRIEEAEKVN